jgi:CBS domain-containing protein
MLVPIVVTVLVSKFVGNMFGESIYDISLHLKKVPFLAMDSPVKHSVLEVRYILNGVAITLEPIMDGERIVRRMRGHRHHGFPVVGARGELLGIILRSQLRKLLTQLEQRVGQHSTASGEQPANYLQTATTNPLESANHHDMVPTEAGQELSCEQVELHRFMNRGPSVVLDSCPVSKAFRAFSALGLRHLVVLSAETGHVVGMLTRKDFIAQEAFV